jgi:hypothetical protein
VIARRNGQSHDTGGRLFLVFDTPDGKQTWEGRVTLQQAEQQPE